MTRPMMRPIMITLFLATTNHINGMMMKTIHSNGMHEVLAGSVRLRTLRRPLSLPRTMGRPTRVIRTSTPPLLKLSRVGIGGLLMIRLMMKPFMITLTPLLTMAYMDVIMMPD